MAANLIVVLSGDIYRKHGVWQTNDANGPGDGKGGPTYDRFRVAAAAYLADADPQARVLATGVAPPRPGAPSVASVIRSELVARGIAAERILIEDNGGSTFQQLLNIQQLAAAGAIGAIVLVTSEWHVPRVTAMLERVPTLDPLRARRVDIVAAEAVLLQRDEAQWTPLVAQERDDPRMRERLALERQGTEQIYAGTYRFG